MGATAIACLLWVIAHAGPCPATETHAAPNPSASATASTVDSGKGPVVWITPAWLKPLMRAWRREYLEIFLTGHLFRKSGTRVAAEAQPHAPPGGPGAVPVFDEAQKGGSCREHCDRADLFLDAGLLPEALSAYEKGMLGRPPCPGGLFRAEIGAVETNLALGRIQEAKRGLRRIPADELKAEEPVLILIDGLLACLDGDFQEASRLFRENGASWYLCPNLEPFAAHSLLEVGKPRDAEPVFQVVQQSEARELSTFGAVGLAESLILRDHHEEAEKLYQGLAERGEAAGLLGLAEHEIRKGEEDAAEAQLRRLLHADVEDYWKGIALVYLAAIKQASGAWSEALDIIRESRSIVVGQGWVPALREQTRQALETGVAELAEEGAHEALLTLLGDWAEMREHLSPAADLLAARAYEAAGLCAPALEIFLRRAEDAEGLFRAARFAWKCGRNDEAATLLDRFDGTAGGDRRVDAKLLRACLLHEAGRIDKARRLLEGQHPSGEPEILSEVARIEETHGMRAEALRDLHIALACDPLPADLRRHLLYRAGELHYRGGGYREALSCFRECRETNPQVVRPSLSSLEVLCLLRLEAREELQGATNGVQGKLDADTVRQLLAAEELVQSIEGEEHGF